MELERDCVEDQRQQLEKYDDRQIEIADAGAGVRHSRAPIPRGVLHPVEKTTKVIVDTILCGLSWIADAVRVSQ